MSLSQKIECGERARKIPPHIQFQGLKLPGEGASPEPRELQLNRRIEAAGQRPSPSLCKQAARQPPGSGQWTVGLCSLLAATCCRAIRGALTPGTLRCSGHCHSRMMSCLNCSLSQGHVFAAKPRSPEGELSSRDCQSRTLRGPGSASLVPALLHFLGRSWEIWKQCLGSRGAAPGRINAAPKESIKGN